MRRPTRSLAAVAGASIALLATVSATAAPGTGVYLLQGEQLVAVQRPVATPQDALVALLAGPTAAERAKGFRTYVPAGTALRSVTVADGVATVDLGEAFIAGTNGESLAGGRCTRR